MLEGPVRYFVHQYTKYVWDADTLAFEQLRPEYVHENVYVYMYSAVHCACLLFSLTPSHLHLQALFL